MRFAVRGIFLLLFALLLVPVRADNVLFIGNSFTFGAGAPLVRLGGGVPKLFEAIADAEGKKVDAYAVTAGGKDWTYHLDQPVTAEALAARTWDWVVLQDYSSRPTHVGNIRDFMRDGETFSDRIAASSPHAGITLYETWARPPVFYTGGPGRDFSGPAQMLGELHDSYGRLRDDLAKRDPNRDARVALVGTAFMRASDRYPAVRLIGPDNHHATAEGYYLAALVIYETIYHGSVKGAPAVFFHGTLKFPPDEAADLQSIADEVAGPVATTAAK
jgi:hypothetical protein